MKIKGLFTTSIVLTALTFSPATSADEVTDWNENMADALLTARLTPPPSGRLAAMVQSAVFDAINGVYRRYTPVHVPPAAPPGASARAAAIQAAYGVLVRQFPAQKTTLDAQRASSLAALDDDGDGVFGKSVERGLEWGEQVTDAIWTWRSTDGFSAVLPPFVGSLEVGVWRPTPPGYSPGAVPQLAYTMPWAVDAPEHFLPPGPPLLGSGRYASDVAEVQVMGSINSAARSADGTFLSLFWNGNTPVLWNRVAVDLVERNELSLIEKARVLATLNVAMADAGITCWRAKYTFVFWRPITAITLAGTDGNDATVPDPTWLPLLTTPNHPEYPSGHSSLSGAAAEVLAAFFGEDTELSVTSETAPGVARHFTSVSAAAYEAADARVFGGIHFRSACVDAQAMGRRIGSYVLANAMQRVHGK